MSGVSELRPRPRLIGILRQRCPRCRRGAVYSGLVAMRETCAVCGYQFGRESGYFTGAMYASYAMAVPLLIVIYALLSATVARDLNILSTFALSVAVFIPFAPIIFRYSRVIWMYVDAAFDPNSPVRRS